MSNVRDFRAGLCGEDFPFLEGLIWLFCVKHNIVLTLSNYFHFDVALSNWISITWTLVLDKVDDFILLIDFAFAEVLFVRISFSSEFEDFVGAVAGSASLDLGKSVL